MRRLVGAAVLGLLGWALLLAWRSGSFACGSVPVRVRGTVIDAATGAPIEGADLLTLRDTGILEDAEGLARRWRIGRDVAAAPARGEGRPFASVGAARTDARGAFDLVVGIGVTYRTNWTGTVSDRSRESPFEAARALLVEREGYGRAVHATKDARWTEQPDGAIVGTLEVGTIRLAPLAPR